MFLRQNAEPFFIAFYSFVGFAVGSMNVEFIFKKFTFRE